MAKAKLFDQWWPFRRTKRKSITKCSEYRSAKNVTLACTQLACTPAEQKRIVTDWCDFFGTPSQIQELLLKSRVPQHLFDAVCNQTQLTGLYVKWGPIKDISRISRLHNLRRLSVGSCSITSLSPIAKLKNVECLRLTNLDRLSDYSSLARMESLQYLKIVGAPFMPKNVSIKNLLFLKRLPTLKTLSLDSVTIGDPKSHTALRHLTSLEHLELRGIKCAETNLDAFVEENLPTLKSKQVWQYESKKQADAG